MESLFQKLPLEHQVPILMQLIVSELRLARHRQWISQAELAEGCGFPQSVIARIESGKSNPTLKTLLTIVAALGVTIEIHG